jgi:hypothetical protein
MQLRFIYLVYVATGTCKTATALELKLMVNFGAIVDSKGDVKGKRRTKVQEQQVMPGPLLRMPVDVQVCKMKLICVPFSALYPSCSNSLLMQGIKRS